MQVSLNSNHVLEEDDKESKLHTQICMKCLNSDNHFII